MIFAVKNQTKVLCFASRITLLGFELLEALRRFDGWRAAVGAG